MFGKYLNKLWYPYIIVPTHYVAINRDFSMEKYSRVGEAVWKTVDTSNMIIFKYMHVSVYKC